MPALFTSTSTLSSFFKAEEIEAGSETSTRGDPSRSQTVTWAPEAFRRLAIAAPMPAEPPVTIAFRPAKSSLFMGGRSIIAPFHGRSPRRENRFHHRRRSRDGPRRGARVCARRRQGLGERHEREDRS